MDTSVALATELRRPVFFLVLEEPGNCLRREFGWMSGTVTGVDQSHLAGEGGQGPLALLVTPGQWGDAPHMIPVLDRIRVPRPTGGHPRTRPDRLSGDKAYSSRRNRRYLRRRQIKHTMPERRDQRTHRQNRGSRGGRPTSFDHSRYARRKEAERTINQLKGFRAVATRFDKRAYVFHGTVTVAAVRLWLRS